MTAMTIAIALVSIILICAVLIQNPKGGGLSSSFGGGDSQQLGGVKQTSDFLDKSTWFLAGALLILILFSNITLNSGNQGSESELLNNESDFEIEEILENNETQSDSE